MDKIGMRVICKNCGKVFGKHFNGDLCPSGNGSYRLLSQFKPATPAPTQPEKCPHSITGTPEYCAVCGIGTNPDSAQPEPPAPTQPSEVGTFIEIIFDASNGPMNMVFVEVENEKGQSVNVGEWHDQADGYSALRIPLGQSTARSQEGRVRKWEAEEEK